ERIDAQFAQRAARATSVEAPDPTNVYVLDLPDGADIEHLAELYRCDPHVEYAQPDYRVQATAVPNDPRYADLWGMQKISAATAWDRSQGQGVVVATVDSGADIAHADLQAN